MLLRRVQHCVMARFLVEESSVRGTKVMWCGARVIQVCLRLTTLEPAIVAALVASVMRVQCMYSSRVSVVSIRLTFCKEQSNAPLPSGHMPVLLSKKVP